MFEELSRIIREEVVATLFHVEVQQDEAQQALQPAEAPQRSPTSTRRRRRRRDRGRGRARHRRDGCRAAARAAPGRQGRRARRRPQRPVLVRLGQEVQALPRGVMEGAMARRRGAMEKRIGVSYAVFSAALRADPEAGNLGSLGTLPVLTSCERARGDRSRGG